MFNPLLVENYSGLSDQELNDKIRLVTQRYYQTTHVEIRFQLSDILDLLVQEQTKRLSTRTESNESFDGLISVN